ncbi:MAG: hypothetical protein FWD40_10045 [Treponema sp.]|nr:hypothetical protein [Treponema sp.]
MKILFNDVIQYSDAPKQIKSPALSDVYHFGAGLVINWTEPVKINSIGIGYTDANQFTVTFNDGSVFNINFTGNGLYMLNKTVTALQMTISSSASFAGRIGAGIGCDIPTSVTKEPSFHSTSTSRVTLAGQTIPGAGGYNFRTVSLDARYKITQKIMSEIDAGYKYTGMDYPFFLDLTDESYKLLFSKLYAAEKTQQSMTFQSGVRRFLYSRKFNFEERF